MSDTMVKVKKLPEDSYECLACAEEGKPEAQPASAFYWVYRTRGGVKRLEQLYLCKRHTDLLNLARQQQRLNPKSDEYDAAYHEKVKAWKRAYAARKLDPKSPDYDKEFHERQKASKRRTYRRSLGQDPGSQ